MLGGKNQTFRNTTSLFPRFLGASLLIPVPATPHSCPTAQQTASQGLRTPSKRIILSLAVPFHVGEDYTVIDDAADNEDGKAGRHSVCHLNYVHSARAQFALHPPSDVGMCRRDPPEPGDRPRWAQQSTLSQPQEHLHSGPYQSRSHGTCCVVIITSAAERNGVCATCVAGARPHRRYSRPYSASCMSCRNRRS